MPGGLWFFTSVKTTLFIFHCRLIGAEKSRKGRAQKAGNMPTELEIRNNPLSSPIVTAGSMPYINFESHIGKSPRLPRRPDKGCDNLWYENLR